MSTCGQKQRCLLPMSRMHPWQQCKLVAQCRNTNLSTHRGSRSCLQTGGLPVGAPQVYSLSIQAQPQRTGPALSGTPACMLHAII